MAIDENHTERAMLDTLAAYRRLIDNHGELMPLLMLHCPSEVVPVLIYRMPANHNEAAQQLYQLGAVLGLAWEVEHYVAASEATIRIARGVAADKVQELYENPPDDLEPRDAISVFYIAEGTILGAGYQVYERRAGRKVQYEEPWFGFNTERARNMTPTSPFPHFYSGMAAGTMMANVGGVSPSAARQRALNLIKMIERPRKERGFRVMEPGKLVTV